MRPTLILICLLIPSGICFGQESTSQPISDEIQTHLDGYHGELQRLQDAYLASLQVAKADIEEKLDDLARKLTEAGKSGQAKEVEAAKKVLNRRTSLSNRIGLRQELIGKSYRWIKGNKTIWTFLPDGRIKSTTTREKIEWVALNDFEVLVLIANGSLRILQFEDDRKSWRLKYLPPAKPGDGKGARLIRK